jgi:hypothetical protein
MCLAKALKWGPISSQILIKAATLSSVLLVVDSTTFDFTYMKMMYYLY